MSWHICVGVVHDSAWINMILVSLVHGIICSLGPCPPTESKLGHSCSRCNMTRWWLTCKGYVCPSLSLNQSRGSVYILFASKPEAWLLQSKALGFLPLKVILAKCEESVSNSNHCPFQQSIFECRYIDKVSMGHLERLYVGWVSSLLLEKVCLLPTGDF